ncbi:lysylphosphatidylglycerol synthase transmembrane domain-containing protein [Pseudodesulfovibrio alkaliphilus]|uniref:lysylphosphatidylglycerol synthase transmembrane domain-containing protein n=1 Tax=Pseudodesulfovibrio alkaliphilus TaxID=2661613 RepID=UPI0012DD79A8
MKKWLVPLALFIAGVTLFIGVARLSEYSWGPVLTTLKSVDPTLAILTLALLSGVFLCAAMKWRIVTEAQCGPSGSLFFYFRYISLAVLVGQVFPLSLTNSSIRIYALKRQANHGIMTTAGLFLWDQLFDFIALSILMCIGVVYVFGNLPLVMTLGLVLGSGFCIIAGMNLLTATIQITIKLLCSWERIPEKKRIRLGQLTSDLLSVQVARKLFSLAMIKYMLSAAVYTCLFSLCGLHTMLFDIYWAAPTAEMAGVLSQMPGGLGALDWTWVGALKTNGLDAKGAAIAVLSMRFLLSSAYVIVTGTIWGVHFVRSKKFIS